MNFNDKEIYFLTEGLLALLAREEDVQKLTSSDDVRKASREHAEQLRRLLDKLTGSGVAEE